VCHPASCTSFLDKGHLLLSCQAMDVAQVLSTALCRRIFLILI
jgi:hypothetical protein